MIPIGVKFKSTCPECKQEHTVELNQPTLPAQARVICSKECPGQVPIPLWVRDFSRVMSAGIPSE